MYSVIMGHLGSDMVAANAVVVVARNLGTVACFGIANAGAILLGKSIGAGHTETVKADASRFCRLTLIAGILGGIVIFLLKPLFLQMADLTPAAQGYLNIMLLINMYYVVGQEMCIRDRFHCICFPFRVHLTGFIVFQQNRIAAPGSVRLNRVLLSVQITEHSDLLLPKFSPVRQHPVRAGL